MDVNIIRKNHPQQKQANIFPMDNQEWTFAHLIMEI